jgi:hypothetical protein
MRDFKIYFSIAVALLAVYLVAEYNKPSPINWRSTLYYRDKIPFGTYVLHDQLNQIFPGTRVVNTNKSLYSMFAEDSIPTGNYLVVAHNVAVSKNDYQQMVKYIANGNNVFIASFSWQGVLADTLKLNTDAEFKKADPGINFSNPKLAVPGFYHLRRGVGDQYFSSFDTARALVLGKNELGHSNFLSFKYGKGKLYLCANPHLFTNFSILSGGADYASKALSYLPPTTITYWDEFQNGDIPEDLSPVRVFFTNPDLQWAYYISLFSLLVFVLYQLKRQQRIIPVVEPLANSTLEFVNVVGQVYYEQRNNRNICDKKISYWLEHVRTRFNLKTNPLDKEFIENLSLRTGVTKDFIVELINYIDYIQVQERVSDHDLMMLNHLIEKFYTQAA